MWDIATPSFFLHSCCTRYCVFILLGCRNRKKGSKHLKNKEKSKFSWSTYLHSPLPFFGEKRCIYELSPHAPPQHPPDSHGGGLEESRQDEDETVDIVGIDINFL
jgi:hypothetical protein